LEASLALLDDEIGTLRVQRDKELPLAVKCQRAVRDRDNALAKTRATAEEMAKNEDLINKLLRRQQELVERMAVQQKKADDLAQRASELSVALAQAGCPTMPAAPLPPPPSAGHSVADQEAELPDAPMLTAQETAEAEAYLARLDQEWQTAVRPGAALAEPAAKKLNTMGVAPPSAAPLSSSGSAASDAGL
jgi:hypothetical protein